MTKTLTASWLLSAILGLTLALSGCGKTKPAPGKGEEVGNDLSGLLPCGGEGPGRVNDLFNRPFGLMLQALDDLQKNEVYICTGASPEYALWGELMSTCARNRGAAGAVVDGYARDTRGILELGFPVFAYGRYARDQRPRGKVIDFRCTIRMGAVTVKPGDIVFGDLDGVCVVPRDIEKEVIEAAWKKAHGEKRVFEAIKQGMGAQEAWDTFGIL